MTLTLAEPPDAPWRDPGAFWPSLDEATRELDPPFGVIDATALAHNAFDMLRRAGGRSIRVASKSVRVRGVLEAVLALPGYRGVLAFTLAEALWLAEHGVDDVVVGYPSADRGAIAALAHDPRLASRIALMVDSIDQLDLVDAVAPPGSRETLRLCLELDASWDSRLVGFTGVRRSPVHTPDQARSLAERIAARREFRLVGMMGYEAQIAGVVNQPPGNPVRGVLVRWMQRSSAAELAERRAAAVARVREIAELEFVNGGGTGSLESTSADGSVTEIAAGSGLFGPHLFDGYRQFRLAPAASFALSVVRKPGPRMATLHGGGWVASGPPAPDRVPKPVWPEGLRMLPREMAGEVQTPVTGRAASALAVGDRVWFRHTKAGELSEHLNELFVVDRGRVVAALPTYRGEGKVFL